MSRHDILTNTILQGRIEGISNIGRPTRNWMEDVYEWTVCLPDLYSGRSCA